MASFAQKIEQQRPLNIYLVTGGRDHTGRPAWYYIDVLPHRKLQFERVLRSGAMSLTEYGTILQSGYGTKPPQQTIAFMKQEYGFEG
ncbi:MAG: hypothetical protein ACKVOE_06365 [Rickettsiales bacterium]